MVWVGNKLLITRPRRSAVLMHNNLPNRASSHTRHLQALNRGDYFPISALKLETYRPNESVPTNPLPSKLTVAVDTDFAALRKTQANTPF